MLFIHNESDPTFWSQPKETQKKLPADETTAELP